MPSTGNSYTVKVIAVKSGFDNSVVATKIFTRVEYVFLSVQTSSGGSIQVQDNGVVLSGNSPFMVSKGTVLTLTAQPATSHVFRNWTGASNATTSTVNITMNTNKSIGAIFPRGSVLTVGNMAGVERIEVRHGGNVLPNNGNKYTVNAGDNLTLTAILKPGYVFRNWTGASTATTSTVTITMDADKTINTSLSREHVFITVPTTLDGGIIEVTLGGEILSSSNGVYEVPFGRDVLVRARAHGGHIFTGWTNNFSAKVNPKTQYMTENISIGANFLERFTLTVVPPAGGTIEVRDHLSGNILVTHEVANNTKLRVTARAEQGNKFGGWTGTANPTTVPGDFTTATFIMDNDKNISADFSRFVAEIIPAEIEIEAGMFYADETANGAVTGSSKVVLTKNYYMSAYEVTESVYKSVVPSYTVNDAQHPVVVSWREAAAFCNALSIKEGLVPYYTPLFKISTARGAEWGYRLPTEAEWHYAAGGGDAVGGDRNIYAGESHPYDEYWDDSLYSRKVKQNVGLLRANGLGLYDMMGNVSEWVYDEFGGTYPAFQTNPVNHPVTGKYQMRGFFGNNNASPMSMQIWDITYRGSFVSVGLVLNQH